MNMIDPFISLSIPIMDRPKEIENYGKELLLEYN